MPRSIRRFHTGASPGQPASGLKFQHLGIRVEAPHGLLLGLRRSGHMPYRLHELTAFTLAVAVCLQAAAQERCLQVGSLIRVEVAS